MVTPTGTLARSSPRLQHPAPPRGTRPPLSPVISLAGSGCRQRATIFAHECTTGTRRPSSREAERDNGASGGDNPNNFFRGQYDHLLAPPGQCDHLPARHGHPPRTHTAGTIDHLLARSDPATIRPSYHAAGRRGPTYRADGPPANQTPILSHPQHRSNSPPDFFTHRRTTGDQAAIFSNRRSTETAGLAVTTIEPKVLVVAQRPTDDTFAPRHSNDHETIFRTDRTTWPDCVQRDGETISSTKGTTETTRRRSLGLGGQ